MKPILSTLFPLLLASLVLIGTTRIATEIPSSFHGSWWAHLVLHHWWFSPVTTSTSSGYDAEFAGEFNKGCNVFEGKWVLDEERPLYTEDSCPYLTQPVTCQRNGRPDSLYQKWRWKPHQCRLPRLRNKRLMFIGDSIQRTQWESMVCLLQSAVTDNKKLVYKDPPRRIFFAEEYNATVEFYWAPFIVESNSDHATKHTVQKRLVKLDSVTKHSEQWEGVDIMVFESYVWWMYKPLINATTNGSVDIREYDVLTADRMALRTWAKWFDTAFNPQTQKAYFMSLSPTHLWSWEWRAGSRDNCFNETQPIEGPFWRAGSSREMMRIVRDALQEMKARVTLFNITQLSEYRKDGHTTVYTERRGKLLTSKERSEPNVYADCIHWCLPGVPDMWNEILSAYLVYGN